ncbi:MAG: hypothetical protein IKQ25_00065 [Lachnospiraceae bacterium]|nr:hypothetical protein [Lachnospiraceae bacterium]
MADFEFNEDGTELLKCAAGHTPEKCYYVKTTKHERRMGSEEFKHYARLRNGVEMVPSNIRKNYRLDKLPRGKQRGKFFFGCKVGAFNFRKLFVFRKGLGNYASNPLLA